MKKRNTLNPLLLWHFLTLPCHILSIIIFRIDKPVEISSMKENQVLSEPMSVNIQESESNSQCMRI